MSNALKKIKLFGMQNLLLEADLAKIEKLGIDIQHTKTLTEDPIVDKELFEKEIIIKAEKMADFYKLYFTLENSIRKLISDKLFEKYGADWWSEAVPSSVRKEVEVKQKKEKDTPMTIRSEDPLTYTSFGELIIILEKNWEDFTEIIRSKKAMKKTLSEFGKLRNVIAHSCELGDDEVLRFQLTTRDWLRIRL